MTHQILISQINSRTLCIPIADATSLEHLKDAIHRIEGVRPEDQRLILNGHDLVDCRYYEAINQKADFLSLKFALRGGCTGGKGGFGSLLRSAKSVKKTTNYGSCRDLHGRRLRDVQNERRLSEWSEKEKEMKKEDILVQEEKEEKGISLNSKERLDVQTKIITNSVVNSVEKGLALLKEKEQKRKREEEKTNSSFKLFGMEEEDISDSESDEEDDIEQKKKRHCPESRNTPNSNTTTTTTPSTTTTTISITTTTTTVQTSLKMGPPVGSKRTAENLDY
jgi:hypothetical protein